VSCFNLLSHRSVAKTERIVKCVIAKTSLDYCQDTSLLDSIGTEFIHIYGVNTNKTQYRTSCQSRIFGLSDKLSVYCIITRQEVTKRVQ
jgi:hypothetical protein